MAGTDPLGDFDARIDLVDETNGIIAVTISERCPPGELWLIPDLDRLPGETDAEYRDRRAMRSLRVALVKPDGERG